MLYRSFHENISPQFVNITVDKMRILCYLYVADGYTVVLSLFHFVLRKNGVAATTPFFHFLYTHKIKSYGEKNRRGKRVDFSFTTQGDCDKMMAYRWFFPPAPIKIRCPDACAAADILKEGIDYGNFSDSCPLRSYSAGTDRYLG